MKSYEEIEAVIKIIPQQIVESTNNERTVEEC
jgi:hypothetical protein